MEEQSRVIDPGRKRIKSLLVKAGLFVVGRGFHSVSKLDSDIAQEIANWEEGFTFMLKVFPDGPRMTVEKHGGVLRYLGFRPDTADLMITFKSLESAFLVFTAQCGTCQAFAENRFIVQGDLPRAMSLTRCLNILQWHLFPYFIANLILKRMPPMPWYRHFIRVYIYLLGIPFGL